MSALHPPPTTPGTLLCPRCGNTLPDDQAWCLECGHAARTRVHPPPNWRLPVIATLLALALLAAGIAFALVALLDEPEPTPAPQTVTVPAATPPAAPPPASTVPTTPAPVPETTTPTTPGATTPDLAPPAATTPDAEPADPPAAPSRPRRTFTIPGTGIELPATGGSGDR